MNISLFNKPYWLRRADEQRLVKGYLTSGFVDVVVNIHVHPLSTDQIQALPEGERKLKRLEGHGNTELLTADEEKNRKADLLYYHGDWYECLSCKLHDDTILGHFNYQFVIVPKDAGGSIDLKAPEGDPKLPPAGQKDPKEEEGGGDP